MPEATPAPLPSVLVVVHPGSACGSAEFNMGKYEARSAREFLAQDIAGWSGPVVVVDGALSSELPDNRQLNEAILAALKRAGTKGKRVWGCDEEGLTGEAAGRVAKALKLKPGEWDVQVTGCWYHEDDDAGCVNAVHDSFKAMGFKVEVRESAVAFPDPSDDEGEDLEEGGDESPGFAPW